MQVADRQEKINWHDRSRAGGKPVIYELIYSLCNDEESNVVVDSEVALVTKKQVVEKCIP